MTARSAVPPLRTVRTLARSATVCSVALFVAVGAWAAPASATGNASGSGSGGPTGPGDPAGMASLQVQAQELAGQIEAEGRTLDELDAAYNAAQIRLGSLNDQLASLQAGMAATTERIDQTRNVLKEQAVLAYLSGGAPLIYLPDHPGQDPSLSTSYAEIIAGGQKRAVDAYRYELQAMNRQTAALQSTRQEAAYTASSIRSDESQAAVALASQQQTLSQVKGQMAVLVSQVQQAQQQARASEQAQQPSQPTQPAGAPGTAGPATGAAPAASGAPAPTSATGRVPAAPTPARATPTTARIPATTAAATTVPATTATTAAAAGTGSTPGSGGSGASSSDSAVPPQAPGSGAALAYARAQIGKPYRWAGAGPDSFDCSGLVMMAWNQGGVHFPHLAQDQYDMTARITVSQALPGDLIFFGSPDNVYHVGIYIGNGQMIDAPETGQNVSVQSIYWDSLLGAGRVHS